MAQSAYEWHPPAGGWTEDDLLDFPEDSNRYEIIDGSLYVSPMADHWHHWIADEIKAVLHAAAPAGWRAIREIGVRVPDNSYLGPDVTVLRPGASMETPYSDPGDVALVVEVESKWSRRTDRFIKPSLYAEAGIESFWRIERTKRGPVAHLYTRTSAEHYLLNRSVNQSHVVQLPYEVVVAPGAWVGQ